VRKYRGLTVMSTNSSRPDARTIYFLGGVAKKALASSSGDANGRVILSRAASLILLRDDNQWCDWI
jgi:hypothetical protein